MNNAINAGLQELMPALQSIHHFFERKVTMRLSTRGRFAINAMIDLALREQGNPVPLSDLAQRHHISLSYLEQVFAKLRQHGLVESTRGPGGGYALGFRGDSITVADIIAAIEETPLEMGCTDKAQGDGPDLTQDLWNSLHSTLMAHMQTITLRGLAQEQRAKGFKVQERKVSKRGIFARLKAEPIRTSATNSVFALAQVWPARS
jgi:Rrf2 family iron-sulfur cluster assembly transcriptional regulator